MQPDQPGDDRAYRRRADWRQKMPARQPVSPFVDTEFAHLQRTDQTVREQSGELCRILEYTAFGEKGCAVEQFGGFDQSAHLGIVTARSCAPVAGR